MAYGGTRRISGRALLGGFGLLGLVLTIGLMALLAIRVLDTSPVTGDDDAPVLDQLGDAAQLGPSGSAPSGLSGADAARQAACTSDRSMLELASSAYTTVTGSVPPDQAALVAAGLLEDEVDSFKLEPSGSSVVVVGVGDCAEP